MSLLNQSRKYASPNRLFLTIYRISLFSSLVYYMCNPERTASHHRALSSTWMYICWMTCMVLCMKGEGTYILKDEYVDRWSGLILWTVKSSEWASSSSVVITNGVKVRAVWWIFIANCLLNSIWIPFFAISHIQNDYIWKWWYWHVCLLWLCHFGTTQHPHPPGPFSPMRTDGFLFPFK